MKNKTIFVCVIASLIFAGTSHKLRDFHKIGVAEWCVVNSTDKTIQCNYETMGDCEGYRQDGEYCIANWDKGVN